MLRSPDARVAAQLSGMAQSVGYVFAAFGPPAAGALEQATGGWTVPLSVMLGLCACAALCGVGAGRAGHVRTTPPAGAVVATGGPGGDPPGGVPVSKHSGTRSGEEPGAHPGNNPAGNPGSHLADDPADRPDAPARPGRA